MPFDPTKFGAVEVKNPASPTPGAEIIPVTPTTGAGVDIFKTLNDIGKNMESLKTSPLLQPLPDRNVLEDIAQTTLGKEGVAGAAALPVNSILSPRFSKAETDINNTISELSQTALEMAKTVSSMPIGPQKDKLQQLLNDKIDIINQLRSSAQTQQQSELSLPKIAGTIGNAALTLGSLGTGGAVKSGVRELLKGSFLQGLKTLGKESVKSGAITSGFTASGELSKDQIPQTPEDYTRIVESGLVGSVIPPLAKLTTGIGNILVKTLPEKLSGQIFKAAENDLRDYYSSVAHGRPINPTLAREAIDNGIFGTSENMATYSIKKLDQLESQVQNVAADAPAISLPNKKGYINILETAQKRFKSGFLSDRSIEASQILDKLQNTKGNFLDTPTALQLRRYLDGLRNSTSYKTDQKLMANQEELKVASDLLREKINSGPLGPFMDKQRIFINALDSIVPDAVKRKNLRMLTITDAIIGGGSFATGLPGVGIGAEAAFRGFQSPGILTTLAQILDKTGKVASPIAGGVGQVVRKTGPPAISQLFKQP